MPPFSFTTTCQSKDCLSRQIVEAIRINYSNDVFAIVRFREKVETHLFARDIMMNIFDGATEVKKPPRPTTRLEEPARKLPRMGMMETMKDGKAHTLGGPGHHHGA